MFYFTTFILALATLTQQQNGSFSLSPNTTYTPPSQHHIPKEKVTHGVNVYLCEQFQDPITPSINIYYWLRNYLSTCKKLTIKDRSKQQLIQTSIEWHRTKNMDQDDQDFHALYVKKHVKLIT